MENFKNTNINPIVMLLAFKKDASATVENILNTPDYADVYDIDFITKINKSMINPELRDDGFEAIHSSLRGVAVEYLTVLSNDIKEKRKNIIERAKSMDSKLDDYSKPLAIIKKIKETKVYQEYLPNAIRQVECNLDKIASNGSLIVLNEGDIKALLCEISSLKESINKLIHIVGENIDIDSRLKERYDRIDNIVTTITNKDETIETHEDVLTCFLLITNVIHELHDVFKDTYLILNDIDENNFIKMENFILPLLAEINKDEVTEEQVFLFDKALEFNKLSLFTYSFLMDKVEDQLAAFNISHAITDRVLHKVDL